MQKWADFKRREIVYEAFEIGRDQENVCVCERERERDEMLLSSLGGAVSRSYCMCGDLLDRGALK